MSTRIATLALLSSCLIQAQNSAPDPTVAQPNPAAAAPQAPALVNCPAGAPLGGVDLSVESGNQSLPFRTIIHLSEGDTLRYAPVLRGKEKRTGEVALVLVPEKRLPGQEEIIVTDPKPADKKQNWQITQTISVAALVYGPAGLNRKNVAKFLAQDEVLIAQLADYADKTAQAEQLVETLSNSESSSASVNAALNGFASQYGFAVQIDRNAPVASQAQTVFAAMNPQLANYNPLASSTASRAGQTASMATMAATLFFGSPIGLVAGGTAALLDLRAIAFPDTQFRASFAQPIKDSGVNLCGQQGPVPPHTRAAYIWASRIPNVARPSVRFGKANYIPAGQKTPVPVDVPDPAWKYLDRAREWVLVNSSDQKTPIPVVKLGNQKELELDLTKAQLPPGDYRLTGLWDWAPLEATGTVHVLKLSDFSGAHLDPASQDRLLARSSKVPATVVGSDFEFTTKVEVKKLNDEFANAENVRFLLSKGLREGPQDHVDVQIDTQNLDAGDYELLITQSDGNSHPVNFKLLSNPPTISNLPILLNQGAAEQHFVLKGERLELLTKLEAPGASMNLSPPATNQTERSLTVKLDAMPKKSGDLPVMAYMLDRSEPLTLPSALEITGPLPVVASSRLSPPAGLTIAVRPEEFPAGSTLNAMLDVKNMTRKSVLELACADGVGQHASLAIGEQTAHWSLQQISPDQLFLAFDTSGLPAGCALQAVVNNGREGSSRPFPLAHMLRFPRVDSFTVSQDPPQSGARQYALSGENLEMIEKLGWEKDNGVPVSGLPTPLPGPGLKQSIEIGLMDPPNAQAPLYVWLRGDMEGRATTIKPPELLLAPPNVTPPSATPASPPAAPAPGDGGAAPASTPQNAPARETPQ